MPKIAARDLIIRPVDPTDAECLARIYNHFVTNTAVTFETDEVSAEDFRGRIQQNADDGLPWFIAETPTGDGVGYAYASKWKGRCAYRFSVESTVYVIPGREGMGIGSALYARLLTSLREKGMHAVMGGIALPNPASVALHEKLGFEKVAHFREVGFKFDRRIDVGYWQLLLAEPDPGEP